MWKTRRNPERSELFFHVFYLKRREVFEMNLFMKETTAGGFDHKDASRYSRTALQSTQFKMLNDLNSSFYWKCLIDFWGCVQLKSCQKGSSGPDWNWCNEARSLKHQSICFLIFHNFKYFFSKVKNSYNKKILRSPKHLVMCHICSSKPQWKVHLHRHGLSLKSQLVDAAVVDLYDLFWPQKWPSPVMRQPLWQSPRDSPNWHFAAVSTVFLLFCPPLYWLTDCSDLQAAVMLTHFALWHSWTQIKLLTFPQHSAWPSLCFAWTVKGDDFTVNSSWTIHVCRVSTAVTEKRILLIDLNLNLSFHSTPTM